jgi:hypothetical protein
MCVELLWYSDEFPTAFEFLKVFYNSENESKDWELKDYHM